MLRITALDKTNLGLLVFNPLCYTVYFYAYKMQNLEVFKGLD